MTPIHFNPNAPVILSLKDPVGCLDGFNVLYETSNGRVLALPRPAAIKLGMVDPEPNEEISITKHQEGKAPAEWVICLTARSEALRADREAAELTERTRADLATQLSDSLSLRRNAEKQSSPLRQMPKSARKVTQDPPEAPRGTGTYGPVPQVALAGRKTRPEAVPFNVAFVEVTRFVVDGLKEVGEQWNDQAKQDAICSVLISASRQGLLTLWERGGVE